MFIELLSFSAVSFAFCVFSFRRYYRGRKTGIAPFFYANHIYYRHNYPGIASKDDLDGYEHIMGIYRQVGFGGLILGVSFIVLAIAF